MKAVITHHALKRLKKRFGYKSSKGAHRFVETIIRDGTAYGLENGYVRYLYRGHSHLFAHSSNVNGEPVLLMITACNDEKSSEWKVAHRGRMKKMSAPKRSTLQRFVA